MRNIIIEIFMAAACFTMFIKLNDSVETAACFVLGFFFTVSIAFLIMDLTDKEVQDEE